jgi:hypothetical protein
MSKPKQGSAGVREPAVRLVREHQHEQPSQWEREGPYTGKVRIP